MIESFRCKETKAIFEGDRPKKFQSIAKTAFRRLAQLDSAEALTDLRTPDNSLEQLQGDRQGQYSIRINDQYRLCFEWNSGVAVNVEIVDYH